MEEYNRFLHNYNESSDSDSDTGSSIESLESKILVDNIRTTGAKITERNAERNGVERLPTRRPDPKIYNRNALLARENRRKKKVHLETMEKELEETKGINHGLLKLLKKQLKIVKKLEHEKSYYKSIITNQPQILSLVTALNFRLTQSTLALNSIQPFSTKSVGGSPAQSLRRSSCSSTGYICDQESSLAINFEASSENGSVVNNVVRQDAFLSPCPSASPETDSFFNNLFNDTFTDYEPSSSYDGSLNEILEECALKAENPFACGNNTTDQILKANINEISEDHNYVCKGYKPSSDMGMCIHIGQGHVTLEFCPTCNWNATHSPPSDLLQTENVYN